MEKEGGSIRHLGQLRPGQRGLISSLTASGATRRRLLDLGLVPGTMVEMVRYSPLGDPVAFAVRGVIIALRRVDACRIIIGPFIPVRDR